MELILFGLVIFAFARSDSNRCLETTDPGPCRYFSVKWHWDELQGKCKQFYYGGCLGTGNRFNSKQQCVKQCIYKMDNLIDMPDLCLLAKDEGHCKDYQSGMWWWYFDAENGECQKMLFYGCGGNGNRFYSVYNCRKVCGERLAPRIACDHCNSLTSYCKYHGKYNYSCECRHGFINNGIGQCTDVDECRTYKRACDINAWCRNTVGSYRCKCMAGYRGDGKKCTYVGLGRSTSNCSNCHQNSTCTQGVCQCKAGFLGDGFNCSGKCGECDASNWPIVGDVDECKRVPFACDINADCTNVPGSYQCTCRIGYAGNGLQCTMNKEVCLNGFERNYEQQCGTAPWRRHFFFDYNAGLCSEFWYGNCNGTNGNIFSHLPTCQLMCESTDIQRRSRICTEQSAGNDRKQCAQGHRRQRYYFDLGNLTCKSFWFDECQETSENIFPDLLTCQLLCEQQPLYESKGCLEEFDEHYRDQCQDGQWKKMHYFDKNSRTCQEFWYDDCKSESQNIFPDEMTCKTKCENAAQLDLSLSKNRESGQNLELAYDEEEWQLDNTTDPKGRGCESNPCQNNGTCTVWNGRYHCACSQGFTGRNCLTTSKDSDVCRNKPCKNEGKCTPKLGKMSFTCECDSGYKGETCGKKTCELNPCKNGGTCKTVIGLDSFFCDCPPKFGGKECEYAVSGKKSNENPNNARGNAEWIDKLKKLKELRKNEQDQMVVPANKTSKDKLEMRLNEQQIEMNSSSSRIVLGKIGNQENMSISLSGEVKIEQNETEAILTSTSARISVLFCLFIPLLYLFVVH